MKYLIPEMLLILGAIFFTAPYVELCTSIFKFLYHATSLGFFSKPFLAFSFVTMFVFILLGWLRQLALKVEVHEVPIYDLRAFLKVHCVSLLILAAFFVRIFDAISETELISPFWITQYGSFNLLINMAGLFCCSSIMVHLCLSIKVFLKNLRSPKC